ncbi:MAG: EamA family transporter [Bacteroidota bacterium]|nr:EamA family transporter [Bacteroidota bacterium]
MKKFFTPQYYSDKRQSTPTRTKALFALAGVSILWGTTWLASREGVKNMPALQMAGIRQFIGGSILIIIFLIKKTPLPKGKQWTTILILSLLNFIFSNGLSTWGVKYISSGLASIISAIFPMWLVIIIIIKGKRMPRQALAGLVMGFGGVCLIFYEHIKDLLNADFRFGIFVSLMATVTWAFGTLYTKQQSVKFNPYFSLGFQMIISGIVLFFIALVTGYTIPFSKIPSTSWWAIGYLVLFGSVITFALYIYTLQHLPATLASVYAYINPIVAVLLGALLLNEKLTLFIAIGGAVTITGVYLVNNSLKKKIILEPAEPVN